MFGSYSSKRLSWPVLFNNLADVSVEWCMQVSTENQVCPEIDSSPLKRTGIMSQHQLFPASHSYIMEIIIHISFTVHYEED